MIGAVPKCGFVTFDPLRTMPKYGMVSLGMTGVYRQEATMDEDMDDNAPEPNDLEGLEQYAIVANRRQQWDTLLWQMPTMALTGEAFLFTISLGGSTSQAGRIVASILALVVAVASLHSLSAHRLSELADSQWLHEHELLRGAAEVHGVSWRERRMAVIRDQLQSPELTDRLVARTYRFRSIEVWFWTMVFIALTATSVLIIAIAVPRLLSN